MRGRGFTPLSVLIGVVDLAGIIALGALWWVASVERTPDDQPWWLAVADGFALVALIYWIAYRGRRPEGLVVCTLVVVACAVVGFR